VRTWFATLLACAFVLGTLLPAGHASAAASTGIPEKGLLITPVRQYLSGDAGHIVHSSFDVANLTTEPLTVSLSVKQFSVSDYVYDYKFENPRDNWLHLGVTGVTLQPNRTATVDYSINLPPGTAPGGHYYTLFASADLDSQGIHSIIQAADLVYLTVNGKLNTVSHLQSSSIHWLTFGRSIPFTLQPINTGNVYSFVYVSSELHGLFVPPPKTSVAHLLMPGTVRSLSDNIRSPVLPGVYIANYGYKTDTNWIVQQSHIVIFIPPWFIAFVLAILLVGGKFWKKRRTNTDGTPADEDSETTD
jgi:hypothetical protein